MKYYLIAGEPSGDSLGARLMEAIRRQDSDAVFVGIGGEGMQNQGLHSLFNISELAVMGIAEVIPSIPRILNRINQTVEEIKRQQPDVLITIDSWSFCARIHKKIRKLNLNIPQVHYVAPQVWAWKKKRARTMHKYIDLLLTLFPYEPKYFTPYNLDTVFVGHSVIESTMIKTPESQTFRQRHQIPQNNKIMLILPGSRHNEINHLLPDFLEVIKKMRAKHFDFTYVLPTVSTVVEHVKQVVSTSDLPIIVVETEAERRAAFQNADIAVAASGTVALELAILDIPHVIAYKVPKLTEWIAKRCLHIQFVNLTNILLGYEVVPELLQTACNPDNIVQYLEQFLSQNALYRRQMENFAKLRQLLGLGEQTPSDNAAVAIIKMLKSRK